MGFVAAAASFFWRGGVGLTADSGCDGAGEHDERDVPMPAMPGSAFVVVEAKLVLGGLEPFLDAPAGAFNPDPCLDGCPSGAPGGEAGEFTIGKVAPDQQAAGPGAWKRSTVFGGVKISQRAVCPIVQPLTLRAVTCGQALPGLGGKSSSNVLCLPCDEYLRMPGAEPMVGVDAQHVALAGTTQRHLELSHAIHAVGGNPGEWNVGRYCSRGHADGQRRLGCERHRLRHVGGAHSRGVGSPRLRQIERTVDEGMAPGGNIGCKHADLAVGDLASRTRILPPHTA